MLYEVQFDPMANVRAGKCTLNPIEIDGDGLKSKAVTLVRRPRQQLIVRDYQYNEDGNYGLAYEIDQAIAHVQLTGEDEKTSTKRIDTAL